MNTEEYNALRQITEDMNQTNRKSLPEQIEKIERNSIQNALYETDGNRTLAARRLGIGRTCLIAKMKKYGLQ